MEQYPERQGSMRPASEKEAFDRIQILEELMETAIHATLGSHQMDENRISQLLGESVKSRLFSAEESYRLKDKLVDQGRHLDRLIDLRIESILRQKSAAA